MMMNGGTLMGVSLPHVVDFWFIAVGFGVDVAMVASFLDNYYSYQ